MGIGGAEGQGGLKWRQLYINNNKKNKMNGRFNDFSTKTQLLEQDFYVNIIFTVIWKSAFGNFTFASVPIISVLFFLVSWQSWK